MKSSLQQFTSMKFLYNKSHADFHRKDINKKAWKGALEELSLEDVFFKSK